MGWDIIIWLYVMISYHVRISVRLGLVSCAAVDHGWYTLLKAIASTTCLKIFVLGFVRLLWRDSASSVERHQLVTCS